MNDASLEWYCGDRILAFRERPRIMGILNVTPDSFADGGQHLGVEQAIARGLRMMEEGADIVDVGGESTRPGAEEVAAEEELRRVLPVVEALAGRGALVSIDTRKAPVAGAAVRAGARIINDVTALAGDAEMPEVARRSGAGVVLMHMQGAPRTMQADPRYTDVVAEVAGYLERRVRALEAAGLERRRMAVDPGIGFGKTAEHNLRLLGNLPRLCALGLPVVVGLSRKSFLGKLTGRAVGDRVAGSVAALAYCVIRGAHVMRVHDVRESCDAVKVATALRRAGE